MNFRWMNRILPIAICLILPVSVIPPAMAHFKDAKLIDHLNSFNGKRVSRNEIRMIRLKANLECQPDENLKLIYTNNFDDEAALDDWVIEGPGQMSVENGKLRLQSRYAEATLKYLEEGGKDAKGYAESEMERDIGGSAMQVYRKNGKFAGAHFVCWNRLNIPENYIIECDFKSLADHPLHMIMFSHLGLQGQCVFDPALKLRNGIAGQYTKGDLVGYRISFFHPSRTTSNLRKSPEKQIVAKGLDPTDEASAKTHDLRIIKMKNRVIWKINGNEVFNYVEDDPDKVLKGGYFAFRLMNPAMGLYDNLKIYEILTE